MIGTKEWYRSEFINHESEFGHRMLESELSFYDAIATGNIEFVEENCRRNDFGNPEGMGTLSDNPVQNLRYHFVITVAMITRYCVHAGIEQEKAYSLSDYYIQKMDRCKTIAEISRLHDTMCMDITRQMLELRNSQVLSKPIVLCIDYIYSHIHSRITVSDLSEELGLSESYLSKLFHSEMGIPISQYILNLKIEKAKNLLQYSEYSVVDIANYLSFSSQSHFIQVFKKYTGMTPHKYRTHNFRTNWQNFQDKKSVSEN